MRDTVTNPNQEAAARERALAELEQEAAEADLRVSAAIDSEDPQGYMAALKRGRELPGAIASAREAAEAARIRVLETTLQAKKAAVREARIPADEALAAYDTAGGVLIDCVLALRAAKNAADATSNELYAATHDKPRISVIRASPGAGTLERSISFLRSDQQNRERD